MPLVLPRDYRFRPELQARAISCLSPFEVDHAVLKLRRIGIINLMPQAELYEEMLLSALGAALPGTVAVEPVWIRLKSHSYGSSDAAYLERCYVDFDLALGLPFDGLLLTGAPVEELSFHDVRYWTELAAILQWSQTNIRSTLGLCWGAMALASILGIPKELLAQKLFGMFPFTPLEPDHALFASTQSHWCPQSRHAGSSVIELERAALDGRVRLLARSDVTGCTIFESEDRRFLMHQGHPEYRSERLRFEYERDRKLGRTDVNAPLGVDLENLQRTVSSHGPEFLAAWIAMLGDAG